MSSKRTFSKEQVIASDPTLNVWVQANAGTGKTSVLVQRLLRILFRNNQNNEEKSESYGILCLTYTNTGASEMRNRILYSLREWAYKNDDDLRDLLYGISESQVPTNTDLSIARKIFYKYIDNPDMLKIRTIHSFCEEILRRFPIEAGISPSWRLVSGAEQKQLLRETFDDLVNSADEFEYLPDAFSRVADQITEHSLDGLLDILTNQYRYFFKLKNNFNYREQFIDNTLNFLKVSDTAQGEFNAPSALKNRLSILDIISAEKKPAGYLIKIVDAIKNHQNDFKVYKSAFLTATNTKNSNVSKKDYLQSEQELVYNLAQEKLNREIFENTIALFDLTDAFATKYRNIKLSRGLLDFDDLILYTNKLFSDASKMGWVLSQLDSYLHHILIDEAQDTSPEQWDILKSMTTNFFTEGDYENPRSIFVVGDTKQSIFSFQGADPESFAESKTTIGQQIATDIRKIEDVPLAQSFRSAAAILSAVDYFFKDVSITYLAKFINNSHKVFRDGDAGLVEIHPIIKADEDDKTAIARKKYIIELADKIEHILKFEKIESLGRNILPADIMILVQRRHPFVAPLISELQLRNIPVAGSDRIFLPDFPAVRDILYVLRFALDNTDDYMLACVLKSPLFRFSEEELFKICRTKIDEKISLFNVIQNLHPEIYAELSEISLWARDMPPYSFFMKILNTNERREKMLAGLGAQIIDPLEEFLTIALSYERTRPGDLKQFYKWFIDGGAEIKRDIDASAGVRIMTAHSSKGLDSPVVFLIDTVRNPHSSTSTKVSEPININGGWIWKGRSAASENFESANDAKYEMQIAEYYRLLYVAMTRARDRLYVYGFKGTRESTQNSWHEKLYEILAGHTEASTNDSGTITIYNEQKRAIPEQQKPPSYRGAASEMPRRSRERYSFKNHPATVPHPSTSGELRLSISEYLSMQQRAQFATDTGTEKHKKLEQIIIDENTQRGDSDIIKTIKSKPELLPFFGADAKTEAPIAGIISGKFISRRIDRLVIRDDTVSFIDYKTDIDKNARRADYLKQIKEYAALLSDIYPEYKISGYILWLSDWTFEKIH